MGSLSELLAKEGFTSNHKKLKFNRTVAGHDHDSITLPIYICRDRKSIDAPKNKKSSSVVSSKGRRSSLSRRSDEPAIDEVATKAVISILSGYAGKYLRDKDFRDSLREKCCSCLVRRSNGVSDNGVFANMELGIESIEKLIDSPGTMKELKMKSLRNSIGFLTIVAELNSRESKNGTTSGTPNSHLSACAQLYLSIVYKLEKNDRICARHVLQVFVDSPQLARTHLLPDLWDHFFLPHLLHLKIWYNKQIEKISDNSKDQEEQIKRFSKVYEDHMDMGTVQFAMYYKEWLKTGGQPPSTLPSVPLPSIKSRRRSSSSVSLTSRSSINNFLHGAVFGVPVEKQPSMELDNRAIEQKEDEEEEELFCLDDHNTNQQRNLENRLTNLRKFSNLNSTKSDYTWFLPCQSLQPKPPSMKSCLIMPPSELTRAISTISTSENLTECETAVRIMTKAWLNDPLVEKTLSKPSVIEGLLEVLFAAINEEIQELVISLLTEFVTRNEANGKIILSLDPQLEGFTTLMRNSSLFLKAASLLHLVKPEAKQMMSTEWIPLVLRVLEFGDQTQTLFSVRCSPQIAAYYFLDQLLTGFDEDRNLENGRQVISLGGLSLLLRRMVIGDTVEKTKAASVIYLCIQADGRCRHYLADNLNPELILSLLVDARELDSDEITVALLVELFCLNRLEQRTKLFDKLSKGWDCLNTLQILLISLQRATREKRPLVASIMFQLDLMGDPLKSSVYREESIEAITEALDSQICNENVQKEAAKALLILGGRYGYTGTPEIEKWILKEAGYDESLEGGFHGRYHVAKGSKHLNEEDEIEHWQRKAAMGLWISGGEKLIAALGESIANGIPCLARSSLVTVAWMSKFVHTVGDGDVLWSTTLLTMVRQLIESLNRTSTIEERVLASFSLLALSKSSGSMFELSDDEKKAMVVQLRHISKVTWTAKKLTSIIVGSPTTRYSGL
ncbi:putative E3 ubiquitin-protein ligase LIN-1 [Cynara cardunculus var. scolymus]|uniref:putative E3 ubiquitin-protein ligase LIN-1 n=1 Tax=Cynara cardunculus var. scolymus TaxID=59895 RepID=UPI000D62A56C|nr:putative E3 ubiquitin-protein ligase LIN-1 [Cynara cardunculus var. scolymus]